MTISNYARPEKKKEGKNRPRTWCPSILLLSSSQSTMTGLTSTLPAYYDGTITERLFVSELNLAMDHF